MMQVDNLQQLEDMLSRRRNWPLIIAISAFGVLVSSIVAAAVLIDKPAAPGRPQIAHDAFPALAPATPGAKGSAAPVSVAENVKAPFVPPSLTNARPVSVIDAARMVDKAEKTNKPAAQPAPPTAAPAQTANKDQPPTLAIDRRIEAQAGDEKPLSLSVNADGVLRDGSTIAIIGLPKGSRLSAGKPDGTGTWQVTPDDLGDLKVTVGSQTKGTAELVIRLLTPEGRIANERHSSLVVAAADAPIDGRAVATSRTVSPAEIEQLLKHGRDLQKVGYMAGARLFYQRAMDAGSPDGARALGETYDPQVLKKLGARGLEPDPALAEKWYARARELEAAKRTAAHD